MKQIKLTVYLEEDLTEEEVDDLCIDMEDALDEFNAVDKVISEVIEVEEG